MLRKALTSDADNKTWKSLTQPTQQGMKTELLTLIKDEQNKQTAKMVCDTVSDVGAMLLEEQQWPELLPFMFQCVQSGDDTLLVMNWLQPGMTPGPHSHPFEQIAVIVQGTARFHIGDKTYDAGPGSMIRIPPDVEHWAEVIGDEPVMNLDVFNPIREDYMHLVEHQKWEF